MNNPKLIAQNWHDFYHTIGLADVPEVQRIEMRRAFYAGALALFLTLNNIMDPSSPEPTELDLELVSHINAEFAQYARDLVEGRA